MEDLNFYPFLSGGGEMGNLIREKNWQLLPIGSPSAWPQSLRTTLFTVLNAKFPMFLWWGQDLICFYNDAYRPSLGKEGKHPDILGMPAKEAWPEIWPIIEPLIKKVLNGESTFSEDQLIPIFRNNRLENVYWTFSYSPVIGDQGLVEAVLVTCQETTEKIKILKQLQEREEQLLFTIQAADLGIWDLNPSNNKFTGNARLKSWFGLGDDEEIDLSSAINSIADADRERVAEAIQYALSYDSGGHYEIEYGIVNSKTHIEKQVRARGQALFDDKKMAYRFSGTLQDMTEEKKAFEELKKNQERLNLVIEASELGIWEWQLGSDEIIYSDRYLEIFGLNPKTPVIHEDMLKRIHPEDRPIRDASIQQALKSGNLYYEIRISWPDGSHHWIEAKGGFHFDQNQKPYKAIGTLRDITREKISQQALTSSETKFRLLADSMAQFVWTGDPAGNLDYFNKAVYDYSGLNPQSIEKEGWLQIVHPDDREKNVELWVESVKTGRPFYYEHRFRRNDGIYRWQMSRAIPQEGEDGEIQMWVGTSTDIEDQKLFAKELELQVSERTSELEKKNIELEKLNTELESFVYISSHDLQEPLRKIRVFISLISETEKVSLAGNVLYYFTRIEDAARRMQLLIEDLLKYSKLGGMTPNFETIDLAEMVAAVLSELKEQIEIKKAILEIGPLCSVRIIRYQFHQLIMNLLSNALKFSDKNRIPVITMKAFIIGTECHIEISDNGIGFDNDQNEKIFKVFQRLHNKSEYEGTGIGLSIVQKIVDNHKGTITASGSPGNGAKFTITIPK